MSKLTDKLEEASHGTSQPLGFAVGARREKAPPVLLLASVASGASAEMKLVVDAGLDGAFLTGEGTKSALDKAAKALGEVPWGTWVTEAQAEPPKGSDFQVFSSDLTPLAALGGKNRTQVMQVSPELDDSLLRTIEDLPVDAFLVSLADAEAMTVHQLMRVARVRSVTSKWLFVHLASLPVKEEVERLHECGVSAVVVDAAGKSAADFKALRAAILELPAEPPKRRHDRRSATIPSLGMPGGGQGRPAPEPEPDEDDYDDE
jgi:hypothetical protein